MNGDNPTSSIPPSGAPPVRTSGGGVKWTPPSPEHMARMLPQYDTWEALGQGGMGAVYKARQISLDRTVAVKVLPPEAAPDEAQFIARFKNEAKLMARLNHPGVVGVYDFGETSEGQLYFVMEFVDGSDVAQMLRAQKKLAPEQALEITSDVCDALAYAHKHGIIHRDIKPANILINHEGRVKVADFGLAKMDDPALTSALTRSHITMGTPDFVAPEALVAGVVVDHRADLYAVGVMLYQMLTGEVPRGMFKMPSARTGGEVDPRFDVIIAKAMQPDRDSRYQTSMEIRKDLSAILTTPRVKETSAPAPGVAKTSEGGPIAALEASGTNADIRQRHSPKKSPRPAIIGILTTLVIAAGLVLLFNKQKGVKNRDVTLDAGARSPVAQKLSPSTEPWVSAMEQIARQKGASREGGALRLNSRVFLSLSPVTRDGAVRMLCSHGDDVKLGGCYVSVRNAGKPNGTGYQAAVIDDRSNIGVTMFDPAQQFRSVGVAPLPASGVKPKGQPVEIELRAVGSTLIAKFDGKEVWRQEEGSVAEGVRAIRLEDGAVLHAVETLDLSKSALAGADHATMNAPFENTLGMRFVPVTITGGPTSGKRVLFSVWETRVKDFEVFAKETARTPEVPDYEQTPMHPAAVVTWDEARSFCEWLTKRERSSGKIGAGDTYRLPGDHEWSCAAGIGSQEKAEEPPESKDQKIKDAYPWGSNAWPPPGNSGNYWSEELRPLLAAGKSLPAGSPISRASCRAIAIDTPWPRPWEVMGQTSWDCMTSQGTCGSGAKTALMPRTRPASCAADRGWPTPAMSC